MVYMTHNADYRRSLYQILLIFIVLFQQFFDHIDLYFLLTDDVVIDRQKLAEAGVVTIISQIDKNAKRLIHNRVISYGLVSEKQTRNLSKELEEILLQFLTNTKDELLNDQKALENQIRQVIRKHIFRKLKKYPTIVPVVYLM